MPRPDYSINLFTETTDGVTPASVEYKWMESIEDDISTGRTDLPFEDTMPSPNPLIAYPYSTEQTLAPQVEGLRVTSIVSYSTPKGTVKYYSNGLPRIPFSVITNQAAVIEGPVYSPGATQVMTDVEITQLGDLYTNKYRQQILQNVSKLIGGAEGTPGVITNMGSNGSEVVFSDGVNYSTFEGEIDGKKGKVFYVRNGDFIIDAVGSYDVPITFIADGGDIFIKTNINAPAPGTQDPGVPNPK